MLLLAGLRHEYAVGGTDYTANGRIRVRSNWQVDDRGGMRVIQALRIGGQAAQALADKQEVRVVGVTSRGVFVQTTSRWVVFVSSEASVSPLTVTVGEDIDVMRAVEPGTYGTCEGGNLRFDAPGICVALDLRNPWEPPPPDRPASPPAERLDRLTSLAGEILTARSASGIPALLVPLMTNATTGEGDIHGSGPWTAAEHIQAGLQRGEVAGVVRGAEGFLGLGPGLTPSGDDLIIGLLLALHRWEMPGWGAARRSTLNRQVVEAAYARTSTISANLIECAAAGGADERLLHAIDHLWTGYPSRAEALAGLHDWGASSGADALTGMAIALTMPADGDPIAGD